MNLRSLISRSGFFSNRLFPIDLEPLVANEQYLWRVVLDRAMSDMVEGVEPFASEAEEFFFGDEYVEDFKEVVHLAGLPSLKGVVSTATFVKRNKDYAFKDLAEVFSLLAESNGINIDTRSIEECLKKK